ncbi:MAG: SET domain-containing protein-lysine N-methyltransferase [Saprospiraceae bacterium]|nr:SET domain-containing protein-lysine N-methyltransferase [Saprospiraceae bacterium]
MQQIPSLYITDSELGGRGVFSSSPIEKGSIIEIAPVLVIPGAERDLLDKTIIHDYYFIWGLQDQQAALILGNGSIYNHSFKPNAEYRPDFEGQTMSFFALMKIEAGQEITVNYNGSPDGKGKFWFHES